MRLPIFVILSPFFEYAHAFILKCYIPCWTNYIEYFEIIYDIYNSKRMKFFTKKFKLLFRENEFLMTLAEM